MVVFLRLASLIVGCTAVLLGPSEFTSIRTFADDWHQDAHDAQRTGYTPIEPREPWRFVWSWNGPDAQGGATGHFVDVPREGRTVVGNGMIFVPAGERGLFALALEDGRQTWNWDRSAVLATPAFDPSTNRLVLADQSGRVHLLESSSGASVGEYAADEQIDKSVLIAGRACLVVTRSGSLHHINLDTMTADWVYRGESPAVTPAAYSSRDQVVVFATADLNVHAVRIGDGRANWRIKPTPNPAGFPNSFAGGWPVIADDAGIVFLRMRLDHDQGLWGGPGPKSTYPNTNSETRDFLIKRPDLQNLFALRLSDGHAAFIPAVGYGGVEDLEKGKPYLSAPPVPVIRSWESGRQIAYLWFRNGQSKPPDGRWDSHLGEMALSTEPSSLLLPGDLRFVEFPNSSTKISDEQVPLTMAGQTIFRAHWGASESTRLTDRSPEYGMTFERPIQSMPHPPVIRRQTRNGDFDPLTHWTKTGLTLYADGRYWKGPGWWVYWDVLDPPTPRRNAYSDGIRPRYTYATGEHVIVQGNGGELFVLRHSGAGSAGVPRQKN